MQIVIDIPNPPSEQRIINIPIHFCGGQVVDAGGYGFEERKTGKWNGYRCSECKKICTDNIRGCYDIDIVHKPNYCPNCGAKMEVYYADSD